MPTLNRRGTGKPWVVKYKVQEGRVHQNQEIYQTARWKNLSLAKRKSQPLCMQCIRDNKFNPSISQMTDHIISINNGGDPWDWDNLEALCNSCHNRKSQKERRV